MRYIDEEVLEDIALGAAVLGTGGGGDPHLGMLIARQAIREHGPVPVVALADVPDDAFIVPVAMMGAPAVANEKLPSLHPMSPLVHTLTRTLGRPATHTMAAEIGGIAALLPIAAAAELGLPLVDADMMGRAFPELTMLIPSFFGVKASPMSIGDDWGNAVVIEGVDNAHTERLARTLCVEMGASALMALYSLTGPMARLTAVAGTLTLASRLGEAVRTARADHADPVAAVVELVDGHRLFTGKVTDMARRTEGGFTRMAATIAGLGADAGSTLTLQSQNEHLVATRHAVADGSDQVLATTPDLIMVFDTATATPVTTEALRFGSRVTVVGAPCDPRYRTGVGLEVVGPGAFGYDLPYVPVEELAAAREDFAEAPA